MRRYLPYFALALLLGLVGWPGMASAAPASNARVSAVEGDLLVKGPDDAEWSYVDRNSVVFDGDSVWADEDSLAEIEIERGAWVRLGPDTRVLVRRLPPDGDLRLTRGSVYVDLSDRMRGSLEVDTPSGRVTVPPASLARLDLSQGDQTRVVVRRGHVIAHPEHGRSRTVAAGETFVMSSGAGDLRLISFGREDWDAFDTWCDNRVEYYASRTLPRGIPEYLPGIYELSDYGDWIDYQGGRYWRPRRIGSDWRPYSNGYWGYGRDQLIWMPYDPWGYTTCHYGRWSWNDRYGYLWRPDYNWGPGWVRWARQGDKLLWAPLDPLGRPVYRQRPTRIGDLLVDALTWSLMPRENLYRRERGLVLGLDRAPRVRLADLQPVREPVTLVRDLLGREGRIRGRRQTEVVTTPASQRLQLLERRPARPVFKVGEVRLPDGRRITPTLPSQFRPGVAPPPPGTVRLTPAPGAGRPDDRSRQAQERAREEQSRSARTRAEQERLRTDRERAAREQAARERAQQAEQRARQEQDRAARLQESERAARERAARERAQAEEARRSAAERVRQQQEQADRARADQERQRRLDQDRQRAAEEAARARPAQDRARAEREQAGRARADQDRQRAAEEAARARAAQDRARAEREQAGRARADQDRQRAAEEAARARAAQDRARAEQERADRMRADQEAARQRAERERARADQERARADRERADRNRAAEEAARERDRARRDRERERPQPERDRGDRDRRDRETPPGRRDRGG